MAGGNDRAQLSVKEEWPKKTMTMPNTVLVRTHFAALQ